MKGKRDIFVIFTALFGLYFLLGEKNFKKQKGKKKKKKRRKKKKKRKNKLKKCNIWFQIGLSLVANVDD